MERVRNELEAVNKVHREEEMQESIFGPIFQERKVLHGPFKGLQYPSYNAIGSALYPKLIGSYEKELHPVIESLPAIDFSEILNIGCGEGYYAIGLALRFPKATIFACDTDPHALSLCKKMAELNHINDRVIYQNAFTPADLKKFVFSKRGLIICDCEGFEKKLFNDATVENVRRCYLVIETHDFIDIEITDSLVRLFSGTHTIRKIKSLDDIEKAKQYEFEESRSLDLPTKKKLFAEGRPAIMEWLFLTPNNS